MWGAGGGRDEGREREEEGVHLFSQLASSFQLGNRYKEKLLSTSVTKKSKNRYKEKSQVQRKSEANPPRDNK